MDTISLVAIFLFFVSVTVITNTLLILFAYKGFAAFTMRITEAARDFESSGATRELIASLEKASEQAVSVTEAAKQQLAEFDPVLENMQARYQFTLAKIDTRVERFAENISYSTQYVRDVVSGPVDRFTAFTSGVRTLLGIVTPDRDDED